MATEQPMSTDWPETLVLYRTRPARLQKIYLPLHMGRVRYSCLKEAADEEGLCEFNGVAVMRKTGGIGDAASRRAVGLGSIVFCERTLEARSLADGQRKRTRPVGAGRHRAREIGTEVSCCSSGAKRWRTELDLGRSQSFEDHHVAATFGTAPKWIRLLGWGHFWFGMRRLFCVE